MFDIMVVRDALKRSIGTDSDSVKNHDNLISLLIHDIFGGEILKTHNTKGWHFYNRIDGLRIDFTGSELGKSSKEKHFEDIISTPDETHSTFEQVDYSTLLLKFVRAFEEAVGLDNYQPGLAS